MKKKCVQEIDFTTTKPMRTSEQHRCQIKLFCRPTFHPFFTWFLFIYFVDGTYCASVIATAAIVWFC